jgi:hypothetical protein
MVNVLQDLTTYKITSLEPRLQVDEVVIGTGGLCGSAMLNMKFKEFIERKLGQEISGDDMNEVRPKSGRDVYMANALRFCLNLTTT